MGKVDRRLDSLTACRESARGHQAFEDNGGGSLRTRSKACGYQPGQVVDQSAAALRLGSRSVCRIELSRGLDECVGLLFLPAKSCCCTDEV